MKERTLIAIVILLFNLTSSCEKISPNKNNAFRGKGSSLIETENSTSYFYEFREVNTKIDLKTGEKQCKNYGISDISPNEIYVYGLDLKQSLSNILGIPEKDIFYQDPDFDKYSFELNYRMKNNLNYINRDTVVNKILNIYNLNLKTDSTTVQAYNLIILDSLKLKNNISKNKIGESSSKMNNYETDLKGVSLKYFSDYLNMHNPNYHFFSTTETSSFYDFKVISKSNIDLLNKKLEEKYGLIYKKDSIKIKRITIIKKAANKV